MNIFDLLLETDAEKLKENSKKDFEVKRLSKALGTPFKVTCRALTNEQIAHISEISKNATDDKLNAIIEACTIDGKRFTDSQLLEKFKVSTSKALLEKLFLPGEVFEMYKAINELSGYGRDAVREIKN